MQLIGKGSFTKCYLKNKNTVLLKSCCPVKECMSLGLFPKSRLFPKVERVDYETYEMKHYPKVSSLKRNLVPKHYAIYKELRGLDDIWMHDSYDVLGAFKTIKDTRFRNTMIEALEACMNYGDDIMFEISPRNVAVTTSGKLILLDVFFKKSTLDRVRAGNG